MAVAETLRPTGQEVLQNPVLRFISPLGELNYDCSSRNAFSPLVGEPTQLTRTQGIIFETLMANPKSTVTYTESIAIIWGITQPSESHTHRLLEQVLRLRIRLGDRPVRVEGHMPRFQLIHRVPHVGLSLTDPSLGWEQFKSREILTCETPAGQVRLRLPELAVFSPFLGKEVQLTPTEGTLLKELMHEPDRVHTYLEVLIDVWNIPYLSEAEINMIRMVLSKLRTKLGDNGWESRLIYTKPGVGLSLTPIDKPK